MKLLYPAIIEKDEDGRFFVTFPDLPEAVTEGENLEEALFNAQEVLTLTLEGRYDEKLHIPIPTKKVKGAHWIAPALRVQSAFLLKIARHKKTLAELARALETSWPAVARLENPRHTPNLRQLEKAAAALGKQVVIDFIDEA